MLVRVFGAILVAWLGFIGFVDWAMHQPPESFGRVMAHMPGPADLLFPFETFLGAGPSAASPRAPLVLGWPGGP